jgi:hypothetical protein
VRENAAQPFWLHQGDYAAFAIPEMTWTSRMSSWQVMPVRDVTIASVAKSATRTSS